jgi:hypothetical protein
MSLTALLRSNKQLKDHLHLLYDNHSMRNPLALMQAIQKQLRRVLFKRLKKRAVKL